MPSGFNQVIPPGLVPKVAVGIIKIQGYFMNPFRHFHSHPDIRPVYIMRIHFSVVVPFRFSPDGIGRIKKNIPVPVVLHLLHPPPQRIVLVAVQAHDSLNPIGRHRSGNARKSRNRRQRAEGNRLGHELGIAHGGIRGAQRGARLRTCRPSHPWWTSPLP